MLHFCYWLAIACLSSQVLLAKTPALSREETLFLPNAIGNAEIPPTQLVKRNEDMVAKRRAVITYDCPVAGLQSRDFRWEAHYSHAKEEMTLSGLLNIRYWDHLEVITNDFATFWHGKYCAEMHEHCCVYTYKARTVGTLFDDSISLMLVTSKENPQTRIRIMEYCIMAGQKQCPLHTCSADNYRTHEAECNVVGVVVQFL